MFNLSCFYSVVFHMQQVSLLIGNSHWWFNPIEASVQNQPLLLGCELLPMSKGSFASYDIPQDLAKSSSSKIFSYLWVIVNVISKVYRLKPIMFKDLIYYLAKGLEGISQWCLIRLSACW